MRVVMNGCRSEVICLRILRGKVKMSKQRSERAELMESGNVIESDGQDEQSWSTRETSKECSSPVPR